VARRVKLAPRRLSVRLTMSKIISLSKRKMGQMADLDERIQRTPLQIESWAFRCAVIHPTRSFAERDLGLDFRFRDVSIVELIADQIFQTTLWESSQAASCPST
jgi:hypothetical protein